MTLLTKSVLPAVIGVYYAYLRNQKTVVENLKRHVFPTIVAFLANSISRSLSSVHRGITYPLSLSSKSIETSHSSSTLLEDSSESIPEKSVECLVLTEPEVHTADVIFIHGLHGSLVNTWRQGDWRHERHHLKQKIVERRMSTGEIRDDRIRKISLKRSCSDVYSVCPKKMSKLSEGRCFETFGDSDFVEDNKKLSKCWPRDWLPIDCPGVRAIALNYTTDPHLWRPIWIKKRNRTSMTERSKEMIGHLLDLGVGNKPIIWVGHSKGGLFIKQILIDSWENIELSKIYQQTKSILFYSVPHKGSYLADCTLPLLKRSVELTEIQRNCPFVLNLHTRFLEFLQETNLNPEIFSFIETSFTFMSFLYLKIVAFESCDPGIGLICGVPLDHREICKPAARDCFLYQELVRLIKSSELLIRS
nr:protein SERAC1 [Onthophagus taurus]